MLVRGSHVSLSLVVGRDGRSASDGDLARALMAGADWAITETWRRFAPMVLVIARRALGAQVEVEDIGQEVFDRVFRKVRTLREPDSFRSFIYACALRVLQTELRSRKVRSWLSFERPEALASLGSQTLDLESREILRKFQGLLDRLGTRDRLVFVLRRMESMTVEEIAATMKISVSTVKRSMTRATARLSRWIDADPGLADLFDGGRLER